MVSLKLILDKNKHRKMIQQPISFISFVIWEFFSVLSFLFKGVEGGGVGNLQ